jgi:chemotaxis protein CheD
VLSASRVIEVAAVDWQAAAAGQRYTLHPGDVACGLRDDRLHTLLGSCVAVVLTDPRRTVAAMCHVVHARLPEAGLRAADTAYGEHALAAMDLLLRQRGISPALCEAFVVGGGNMFPALVSDDAVGERNVRWALAALASRQVRVVFQDVGGAAYRRMAWTVGDGTPEVASVPV